MEQEQRKRIVGEALSWKNTPYHDHGRVKGAGADCAFFPLDVYSTVLKPNWPSPPRYQMQWHLHHGEELYLNYVRSLQLNEISEDAVLPGDFVLFRMGRLYAHGAIILDWPDIIHAVNPLGVVLDNAHVDSTLNRFGITRPLFFTF